MHANRPLFALEMKTGYQGSSKIWGPKIGFPNRIRNKGEYQEVQLRKNKQTKKHAFIDYFLQLQIRPGLYTNYLIKSSQQPNWVGEIILQMMKWDLEKPNSCLKATELMAPGLHSHQITLYFQVVTNFLVDEGKLDVVKEMARVNMDILGISELKWMGMGQFNSNDH